MIHQSHADIYPEKKQKLILKGLSWWLSSEAGDVGSIPGSGRSPGEGNGNPLQYFAWGSPRTEKPGRLQTTGSQKT